MLPTVICSDKNISKFSKFDFFLVWLLNSQGLKKKQNEKKNYFHATALLKDLVMKLRFLNFNQNICSNFTKKKIELKYS